MSIGDILSSPSRVLIAAFARRDEREFLPAALEVIETPASPVGRLFALVIIAFFACALIWSFVGRVDIIATAQGRVAPSGEVKVVQPLDPGIVRVIHVQDGDQVRAGQLLVELDPTQAGADQSRLARDLLQAKLDVARLTALKATFAGGAPGVFVAPQGAPADRLAEAEAAMRAQAEQEAQKLADLTQQIDEKRAEAAEIAAETDKINATLPMLAEKERIHEDLTAKGYGTSLSYLDAQQQLAEARHDLLVQKERAGEAAAARAALERQRAATSAEYAAGVLEDLRKAEEQADETSQELVKASDKSADTQLRAPIDGVVQQLTIHSLGGVVMPAERLMVIVPDTRNLVVEAQLANRDVGFVHVGQPAKVKVETFNFTRYGLLDGKVIGVSRDALDPALGQATPTAGASQAGQPAPAQGAPQGAGSAPYVARIALSRTSMTVDGEVRSLRPGMAVTAEIRTGDRTIIDYLLSPLARKTSESLHER
jgi:hemolysin D